MPFDQKNKLLFVHIPKTAGTSVEYSLDLHRPWHIQDDSIGFGLISSPALLNYNLSSRFLQHLTFSELKLVYPKLLSQFTSFAVVRDPWSRLISSYCRKDPDMVQAFNQRFSCDLSAFSFSDYIEVSRIFDHPHLRSQIRFVENISGAGSVSPSVKIFKYENLEALASWLSFRLDRVVVFPRVNVNIPKVLFPVIDRSEELALRRRVLDIYSEDYELLGYL
jgi:hypothetical protein